MSISAFAKGGLTAAVAVWMIADGAHAQTPQVAPVNTGANPYRVIRDWAKLTLEDRPWGGSNGVAIDRDGKTVWATDRCVASPVPGCLGSKANPVHHFDADGKEIGVDDEKAIPMIHHSGKCWWTFLSGASSCPMTTLSFTSMPARGK